jgi:hypothetical protein
LTISIAFLTALLHLSLGERCLSLFFEENKTSLSLRQSPSKSDTTKPGYSLALAFVFGLALHLLVSFILFHFGASLPQAFFLPLLIGLRTPRGFIRLLEPLLSWRPRLVNFLPWLLLHIVLAISLFNVSQAGVTTIWRNNYGDLTFHLGMISSFVYGENRLPEYHLYAGEKLSYPFLINFWSAAIATSNPALESIREIFIFQWLLIWLMIYRFFNGDKVIIAPWLVLLAGGAYLTFGENSGELIPKNQPWASFITTIWVTQRTALLGLLMLGGFFEMYQFFRRSQFKIGSRAWFALGLFLALMPLCHTFFFIIAALFLTVEFLTNKFHLTNLLRLISGGAFTILSLPWILAKSSTISFFHGWSTGFEGKGGFGHALNIWSNLASTAALMLIFFISLFIYFRVWRALLLMLIVFIFGNLVKLSIWDWDQIKLFLALYSVLVLYLAVTLCNSQLSAKVSGLIQILAVALIIPSGYEVYRVLTTWEKYTVYTAQDLKNADKLRELTNKSAIIAIEPTHNSFITLSGRRIFYGYDGTLFSHGIKYLERGEINISPDRIASCKEQGYSLCPTHFYDSEDRLQALDRKLFSPLPELPNVYCVLTSGYDCYRSVSGTHSLRRLNYE